MTDSVSCDEDDHDFIPQDLPGVLPENLVWTCTRCPAVMQNVVSDAISARDLHAMLDSSLRRATHPEDNQTIRGEKWFFRHARWTFLPFRFELIAYEFGGCSFVLLFRYREERRHGVPSTAWVSIADTARYAELLRISDNYRKRVSPFVLGT